MYMSPYDHSLYGWKGANKVFGSKLASSNQILVQTTS